MKTIVITVFGFCAYQAFTSYLDHWHLPTERLRVAIEQRLDRTRWCSPVIVDRSVPGVEPACAFSEARHEVRVRYRNPYEYDGATTLFVCATSHGEPRKILLPHEVWLPAMRAEPVAPMWVRP